MCGMEKQGRTGVEAKGDLKMGTLSPFILFWTHRVAGLHMPNFVQQFLLLRAYWGQALEAQIF